MRNTAHVCYVKLIVSGLDYTLDSVTRKVLENALTSATSRGGRLYATQFLVVLLRARIPNFEVWGIPMIIHQTKDTDRSVALAAMDVLEEACHEKVSSMSRNLIKWMNTYIYSPFFHLVLFGGNC